MDFAPEEFADTWTGKPLALFGPQHVLWVPPQVEIAPRLPQRDAQRHRYSTAHRAEVVDKLPADWSCPHCHGTRYSRALYDNGLVCNSCSRRIAASAVPCVIYPVPPTWQVTLTPQEEAALVAHGGYRYIANHAVNQTTPEGALAARCFDWQAEHWGPRVSRLYTNDLESVGWQQKTDTRGLLNAFLRLAQDPITEQVCQHVKRFVERWGPLWLCRNWEHFDCHWTYTAEGVHAASPCLWAPVEEVREFVRKAWHAKVIIQTTIALRDGKPVPESLVPYMNCLPRYLNTGGIAQWTHSPAYRAVAQQWLVDLVNEYLVPSSIPWRSGVGGPRLWMAWDDQRPAPTLRFHSGLGFLSAVWVEMAQTLCKAWGFMHCSRCGNYYLRTTKRPRTDQANYCETCGEQDRGSKAQYRRRQADLRAEARRLHVQGMPSAAIAQQLGVEVARVDDWIRPLGKAGRPRRAVREE